MTVVNVITLVGNQNEVFVVKYDADLQTGALREERVSAEHAQCVIRSC